MTSKTVLLVTASYDQAAELVTNKMDEIGVSCFRLNTDEFPGKVSIDFDPRLDVTFKTDDLTVKGQDIQSVWYRRNVAPNLPEETDSYHQEFCARETQAFLTGAITSLQTNRWISEPAKIWQAERKLYQLSIAHRLGFRIPPTLVTNNENSVISFAQHRQVIAKAVSSGYIDSPDGYQSVFTTSLTSEDMLHLEGLSLSPVTFQEQINKKSDIRVTIVGQEIFTAEILSQEHPSSQADWRATTNPLIAHRHHQLPDEVAQLCKKLVTQLGLKFGAIDLALTNNEDYIFFEINPNGEWLWLEDQLKFPIAERIVTWLTS